MGGALSYTRHVLTLIALNAGPEQPAALQKWFQKLASNAEQGSTDDQEEYCKWAKVKFSTLGANLMEQDLATLFATAMNMSVYVIGLADHGQFAQVTLHGESGRSLWL